MLQVHSAGQQGQPFMKNYSFGMNLIVACGCFLESGLKDDRKRIEHDIVMNHHRAHWCQCNSARGKCMKSIATNICCCFITS